MSGDNTQQSQGAGGRLSMYDFGNSSAVQHDLLARRNPVLAEEWVSFFDCTGRLNVPEHHVYESIFRGGLDPDIRIEAWKFLLGIYSWNSTFDDRVAIRRSKTEEYFEIKARWFDDMDVRSSQKFMDENHQIEKDVHRTDRTIEFFKDDSLPNPNPDMVVGTNTNLEIMKDILLTYNMYNPGLGYVQGMSDLLSPLFVAMGDESMAFWVFTAFMDRMKSNFDTDQVGMTRQLASLASLVQFMDPKLAQHFEDTGAGNMFFCFRWILVWFKREFTWEDIIRLWEAFWTNHLTNDMLLFVAFAILEQHRDTLINQMTGLDDCLQYINSLSGKIQLESTLAHATSIFFAFERKIHALQRHRAQIYDIIKENTLLNNPTVVLHLRAAMAELDKSESLLCLLDKQPSTVETNPLLDGDLYRLSA